jgi:phospholipid transport system substrate-binding protein
MYQIKQVFRVVALSFVVMCMCWVGSQAVAADSPMQVIKKASDDLFRIIDKQHAANKGYTDEQKRSITAIANRIFDFRQIARLSLGRNIKKFSRKEFDRFAGLFARMLENRYIEKLEHYSGEKVVFERERILSPKKALVETKIFHNGKEIPVHYRMFRSGARWRGYDIVIEGISLVKNYRTQFQTILKSGTPADLIKQLENKLKSSP